jgi:hypothetical protein
MAKRQSQILSPQFRMTRAKQQALERLSEFFVLTTNALAALQRGRTPTESDQRTARRTLCLLYQAGYVHRIPYLDLKQTAGGATYAYGLSRKGVKAYGGKPLDDHSQRTLDHELDITQFHISLKQFCANHMLESRWQQTDLKRVIHPDAYFSITDPNRDGKNTNHFFLEIERCKVGNQKNGEPSIMRKLARYYDVYNTAHCEHEWNFRTFRVIVQVPKAARANHLLASLATSFKHPMFWIGDSNEQLIYRTPRDYSERTYSLLDI